MGRAPARAGRWATVTLAVVLTGTGCVHRATLPEAAGVPRIDPSLVTPVDGKGACALAAKDEVEAALNAPVGTATPGQGRPLLAGMEMCRMASGPSSAWLGLLTTSARTRFRSYARWNHRWVDRLEVEGHDAVWDPHLRTLVVLAGEQALGLQLLVRSSSPDKGEDESGYLRRSAISLARAVLVRLDRPVSGTREDR